AGTTWGSSTRSSSTGRTSPSPDGGLHRLLELQVLVADLGLVGAQQQPDQPPARVDLAAGQREAGRRRGGVVVVVQAFAAGDPGQPLVVGGEVVVGSLSVGVPDGVDRGADHQVG